MEYYSIMKKEQTVDTCNNVDKSQHNYSKMKDTIAEKKNSLDVNDSRLGTAGEKISELEDI